MLLSQRGALEHHALGVGKLACRKGHRARPGSPGTPASRPIGGAPACPARGSDEPLDAAPAKNGGSSWCMVAANLNRAPQYGTAGTIRYTDPVLGTWDYDGVRAGRQWYFVVEVSDVEIARIAAAPLQGNGGRKYGGTNNTGPWFASFNPNAPWPGTNLRPWLRPSKSQRATVVPLTPAQLKLLPRSRQSPRP